MDNTNINKNNLSKEETQSLGNKKQLKKSTIIAIVFCVLAVGGISTYILLDKLSVNELSKEDIKVGLNINVNGGNDGYDGLDSLNPTLEEHETVEFELGQCTAVSNPNIDSPCEDISSFKNAVEEYLKRCNEGQYASDNPTFAIPSVCVKFSLGSSLILQKDLINSFADYYLKTNKQASILVEGYTCDLGDEASNMNLSERRATAVKQVLVALGIPEDRIELKWYGESKYKMLGYSSKEDHRRVNVSIK